MRVKAVLTCTFLLIFVTGASASTYKTLLSFYEEGETPYAGLTFDRAGNLYGTAAYGLYTEGSIFQLTPSGSGWQVNVLYQFDFYNQEGADPVGGLVVDEAGNIYGTTSHDFNPEAGCGSVFKLAPTGSSWTLTYLRYFSYPGAEGCEPEATLSYSNGRLWGTTKSGGSKGYGTVFSMDTSGGSFQSESFPAKWKGREPLSALTKYGIGTTYSGGNKGQGNIYSLDPNKGLINKRSFQAKGKAGYAPMGDLLAMDGGFIFGTTSAGGAGDGGTVFQFREYPLYSGQWHFSILHSFTRGSSEGWAPMGGLTADAAGNLYGTTQGGGPTESGCGTVFKLSPNSPKWTYSVFYGFDYWNLDGCLPTGRVVLDASGNLYGTTLRGGDYDGGTVYEIDP